MSLLHLPGLLSQRLRWRVRAMNNSQAATLIAKIFALAGNTPQSNSKGCSCGHEPVHTSKSGTCVKIDGEKGSWYCASCNTGGDAVKALMSLRGIAHDEATTVLRKMSGGEADTGGRGESQATQL